MGAPDAVQQKRGRRAPSFGELAARSLRYFFAAFLVAFFAAFFATFLVAFFATFFAAFFAAFFAMMPPDGRTLPLGSRGLWITSHGLSFTPSYQM